jgi:hypothetical protein
MTDFGTPEEWAQGAGAFKNAIDALRSALQIIKDVTSGGKRPTDDEQKVIGRALEEAEKAARLADAQTAKALGYTLCHCQFPPVPMLTVGFLQPRGNREGPVHECPKCGILTSGVWAYTRTVPPRTGDSSPT